MSAFCELSFVFVFRLCAARDIFWKIFLGRSAEKMTDVSKSVMATIGEWELLDITSDKKTENDIDSDGLYVNELEFYVSD